jgi:CopG family nickel-responsive transcriptional regulator
MTKSKVVRFGVSLEPELLERFDRLIGRQGYGSRSDAIRRMVNEYLVDREWQMGKGEVVGTITLIYDHHVHDLSDKLTDLQHHYFKNIVSTTHIHLDEHNCLEVLVLRGKSREVKHIADKLISTRGVKHGRLAVTSAGKGIK